MPFQYPLLSRHFSHRHGVVLPFSLPFSLCMLLITAMLDHETTGKMNTVCQVNLPGDSCVTGLCACASPLLQACFHLLDLDLSLLALGIAITVYKQIC